MVVVIFDFIGREVRVRYPDRTERPAPPVIKLR